MAEGLFKIKVKDSDSNWMIGSAGTWAVDGSSASAKTVDVLRSRGFDMHYHRSQAIDQFLMQSYQLILTMERGHKEAIQVEFPDQADNVYLLSEMIDQEYEIDDPVGGTLEDYECTALEIEKILDQGFNRINSLAGDSD
jgi:protein-tyrosine phosphatase